jgi:hypothetical protein
MNKLPISKHLIRSIIVLLVISFSNVSVADTGSVAVYEGTLSGEWSGEVMREPVSGTFSITISADGTISGTFSGFQSGIISGTVNAGGNISVKGSAGFSEWIGKINISDGRLSGSGSWKGYGGEGVWSSK